MWRMCCLMTEMMNKILPYRRGRGGIRRGADRHPEPSNAPSFICIYIYIYIHRYVYIHTSLSPYISVYIYIYRERERKIYICVYIYICMYVYIYIYVYTYLFSRRVEDTPDASGPRRTTRQLAGGQSLLDLFSLMYYQFVLL